LGKKFIDSLQSLRCTTYHLDQREYTLKMTDIESLIRTPAYADTVLAHWFMHRADTKKSPEFVQLILNSKFVPAYMSKLLDQETAKNLKLVIEKKIINMQQITTQIDNIKQLIQQNLVGGVLEWIRSITSECMRPVYAVKGAATAVATATKALGMEYVKTTALELIDEIQTLIEFVNKTINPNILHAIDLIFFYHKYTHEIDLWDYITVLIEFIICIFRNQMVEIKNAIIDILDWYKDISKMPENIKIEIETIKRTINDVLNFDTIKKLIMDYLNDLPIRFVLLDEIFNEPPNRTCTYQDKIKTVYLFTTPPPPGNRLLIDFLQPDKNNNYNIPPSVLLLLSIKLNPEGLKKGNNIYVRVEGNPFSVDTIQPRSWYHYIETFTRLIYTDGCIRHSIEDAQRKLKDIQAHAHKKLIGRKFLNLFTFKKDRGETGSIDSETSIEQQNEIKMLQYELELLKVLKKDEVAKSTVQNTVLDLILKSFNTNLNGIHAKICRNQDLTFSDFDGILGIFKHINLIKPILQSSFLRNYIIKILTKFTAFIPLDITTFNILNLEKDKYNKFVKKYKFFEIMLQQKYGQGGYNDPFNPSEKLLDDINMEWQTIKHR